jgi:hypothetical protein
MSLKGSSEHQPAAMSTQVLRQKSGRSQGKIKSFFKLVRRPAATARVDFVADHVTAPQKLLWDGKSDAEIRFHCETKTYFPPELRALQRTDVAIAN